MQAVGQVRREKQVRTHPLSGTGRREGGSRCQVVFLLRKWQEAAGRVLGEAVLRRWLGLTIIWLRSAKSGWLGMPFSPLHLQQHSTWQPARPGCDQRAWVPGCLGKVPGMHPKWSWEGKGPSWSVHRAAGCPLWRSTILLNDTFLSSPSKLSQIALGTKSSARISRLLGLGMACGLLCARLFVWGSTPTRVARI